jgi:hypothetical protein
MNEIVELGSKSNYRGYELRMEAFTHHPDVRLRCVGVTIDVVHGEVHEVDRIEGPWSRDEAEARREAKRRIDAALNET